MLFVIIVASCNQPAQQNASSGTVAKTDDPEVIHLSKAQFDNGKMEIGQIMEKPFAQTVQTTGVIDVPPQNRAVIGAFAGGYVKNIPLLVGDRVSKGQRVVTLENPEFIQLQQSFLEVGEQISYLKAEFERQKVMFEENITSQKSFLKAESEYKSNLARYNSLKKNLELLNINPVSVEAGHIVSQVNIYSPIAGNVTAVLVNTGSFVSPSDEIMEIMNTDHIHLELKVFEKDLMDIRKGQDIFFTVPEATKDTFRATVHLVGTTIDPATRVALIHGHIDEKESQRFHAGMFIDAQVITGTQNKRALPENAVVEMDGKQYVLVVEKETADEFEIRPVEIKVGETYKGYTAIDDTGKLNANAKFLVKGAFVLMQEEGGGGHSH